MLAAVSRAELREGAVAPCLKTGNLADRGGVVAATRSALDAVSAGNGRNVTVVVPDAAVRVLLLEFDELPGSAAEALPVVRFRLKKLVPFDADDAAVTYQVMSSAKNSVSVLVVAMPRDVLAEYEGVVTAAGYLPGAVLPSTLAALAGLEVSDDATLVVNAGHCGVTTAIVKSGVLLLHRSLDMTVDVSEPVPEQHEAGRLDAEASMQSLVLKAQELHELVGAAEANEVVQEVNVAAAYFEDTLQVSPRVIVSAGPLGAERLAAMMEESGIGGLLVREMVDAGMLQAGAATATTPRSWLAGVRGALKD